MSEESDFAIDIDFIEKLSSADPTPGGGGAAAYAGALAGALGSMVGNITLGNPKYEEVHGSVQDSVERLNEAIADLIILIGEDATSFAPAAKAMRMEKGEERDRALDAALVGACETPLKMIQKCQDILEECDYLADNGSKLALSDIGCAAAIARGAIVSASLNIYINRKLFCDSKRADEYKELVDNLVSDGVRSADLVYEKIADLLDAWK